MITKSEIDRARIKKSFDKIQNRGIISKAIDKFFQTEEDTDRKKENLFFAIHEIDNMLKYSYLLEKMKTKKNI